MNNTFNIDSTSFLDKDCRLSGIVDIGKNCKIINSTIENCKIGDNVTIVNSFLQNSEIKNNVTIGPYSHLRPNTILYDDVHIGNFVELKNAIVGARTKIPHLSYVGDCEIGEDVNIGCGVIFCNYDGKNKNYSYIGDKVFIGSNCNIIAPVIIESESFIAAGTTVTDNVLKGEFCIGRVKNEIKHGTLNLYMQNFANKFKYFGTDGIRGIYGEKINDELCIKIGYALTKLYPKCKILIGRDTRQSGEQILENLATGISSGGGDVYNAGIISTAGVAYLTKFFEYDFGISITASHNPSEYNGIKIFNKKGYKLNENQEFLIENNLILPKKIKSSKIKKIEIDAYLEHLKNICKKDLSNFKVFLDCANGAVSFYAQKIFKQSGAKVYCINTNGVINKDASVLNENIFIENMKKSKADIGFCFDGDADRVMCITKNNIVLDGDRILYILSRYRKEKFAVGTIMTNMALEKYLKLCGTRLIRTAVGDKNIAKIIKSKKYKIGAEQSGHIIISEYTTTGDGILTALYLLNILVENPELFEKAEKLNMYSTVALSVETENKTVLNDITVANEIKRLEKYIGKQGRIIVRYSGTEPLIRINVESKNIEKASKVAKIIKKVIENQLKV